MKPRRPIRKHEFYFAGFSFPRYIAELPKGTKKERQERYKYTGGYYTAPVPNKPGFGFYLSEQTDLRWLWADEVDGAGVDHNGWFCGQYEDETIRGLVVRLPHGRFLAGWSMGEGMASSIDTACIYTDEVDAARDADTMAKDAAEDEREYQEEQERIREREEYNQGDDAEETEGY